MRMWHMWAAVAMVFLACVGASAAADQTEVQVPALVIPVADSGDILAQAGEEVLNWMRSVGDRVEVEAPILAEEVLRYGLFQGYRNLIGMGTALLLALGGMLFLVRHCVQRALVRAVIIKELKSLPGGPHRDLENGWHTGIAVTSVISIGLFVFAVGTICTAVSILAKVYLAPRLYLLEQIAGLVS